MRGGVAVMSMSNNVEKLRRGILRRLQIEYDHLHPGAQRQADRVITRTRKIVEKLDSGVRIRSPSGRVHIKKILVGEAGSIADVLDGGTRRKPPSRQRDKKRKVVGRK